MKIFKTSLRRLLLIVVAAIAAGFGVTLIGLRWFHHGLPAEVREALHSAQSWTLISIEPGNRDPRPEDLARKDFLHGYKVLGRLPLKDAKPVIEEMDRIDRGKMDNTSSMCFYPRHALEGRMRDGRKLELLICYECGNLKVYVDGEMTELFAFRSISPDPLNNLLKENGIPLPRQPESVQGRALPASELTGLAYFGASTSGSPLISGSIFAPPFVKSRGAYPAGPPKTDKAEGPTKLPRTASIR